MKGCFVCGEPSQKGCGDGCHKDRIESNVDYSHKLFSVGDGKDKMQIGVMDRENSNWKEDVKKAFIHEI